MSVSRLEVRDRLSRADPSMLAAVLAASDVAHDPDDPAPRLAAAVVDALWWRSHSPAGQLLAPDDLDALITRAAKQLNVQLPDNTDTWVRLRALSVAVAPDDKPVRVEDIPPADRARLGRSITGAWLAAGGAGGAFVSQRVAAFVLALLKKPAALWLARLPNLALKLGVARAGATKIAALSGPIGVGLALLSLNQALGPSYERALPLLVGVGLIDHKPVVVH